MKPSAVLFDLDGTLADTAPDLGAALNRLRQEENRTPLLPAEIRRRASHGAKGLVDCGFDGQTEDEQARLIERFLVLYAQRVCIKTSLFPGAHAMLAALKVRGIAWGVATNKSERFAKAILQTLGVYDGAGCVVYGDTTARKKPAPDMLLLAAEQLALTPQRCLYIGDSERDAIAAKAAGMPVLIAAYGYESKDADTSQWNCDGIIDELSDILPYLDRSIDSVSGN